MHLVGPKIDPEAVLLSTRHRPKLRRMFVGRSAACKAYQKAMKAITRCKKAGL